MGKKLIVGLVLCMVIFGSVMVYSKTAKEDKIELTPSQIDKMIELGLIQVYVTLPENDKDVNTELTYQTSQGLCNIYQDIFGRYYCRW